MASIVCRKDLLKYMLVALFGGSDYVGYRIFSFLKPP
jgi:hypothetical protein